MSMLDWAREEIRIACEHERAGADDEWDYGVACHESALKAYESLMEDGHSGMSIGFTIDILDRLVSGKPLTPIEDVDEVWERCPELDDLGYEWYQCKRMFSLFKMVYPDGSVKYSANDRVVCVNFLDRDAIYYDGFITRIIDDMYPITFPYMPETNPYKVVVRELLTDEKNGDYDTLHIRKVTKPDGSEANINLFYKYTTLNGWVEIDEEEYAQRVTMHYARLERLREVQEANSERSDETTPNESEV